MTEKYYIDELLRAVELNSSLTLGYAAVIYGAMVSSGLPVLRANEIIHTAVKRTLLNVDASSESHVFFYLNSLLMLPVSAYGNDVHLISGLAKQHSITSPIHEVLACIKTNAAHAKARGDTAKQTGSGNAETPPESPPPR